jgi:hypothetical protein
MRSPSLLYLNATKFLSILWCVDEPINVQESLVTQALSGLHHTKAQYNKRQRSVSSRQIRRYLTNQTQSFKCFQKKKV